MTDIVLTRWLSSGQLQRGLSYQSTAPTSPSKKGHHAVADNIPLHVRWIDSVARFDWPAILSAMGRPSGLNQPGGEMAKDTIVQSYLAACVMTLGPVKKSMLLQDSHAQAAKGTLREPLVSWANKVALGGKFAQEAHAEG